MTMKHAPNWRLASMRTSMTGFLLRSAHGTNSNSAPTEKGGEEDDERGAEPIILLALVKHDLQRAQERRDEQEADQVERRRPSARLDAVSPRFRSFRNEHIGQNEQNHSDRSVDQEAPMPGVVVAEIAAEHRSHDGRDDDGDAVKREGLSALLRRECICQDGLATGVIPPPASP